jgi:hypothetical protein
MEPEESITIATFLPPLLLASLMLQVPVVSLPNKPFLYGEARVVPAMQARLKAGKNFMLLGLQLGNQSAER